MLPVYITNFKAPYVFHEISIQDIRLVSDWLSEHKYFSCSLSNFLLLTNQRRLPPGEMVCDFTYRLQQSKKNVSVCREGPIFYIVVYDATITLSHFRSKVWILLNSSPLDKLATISQPIFSDAFSWMKMYEFRLRFHFILFLRVQLTIFQLPALVQIMAWRRIGDKPLSEPRLTRLTDA